jgi:hypothetical protein
MVNERGAEWIPDTERERNAAVREFLFPNLPPNRDVSTEAVGKRLGKHVDEPVPRGADTLTLRSWRDTAKHGANAAASFAVRRS